MLKSFAKNILRFSITVLLLLTCFSHLFSADAQESKPIIIGSIENIYSKVLKENRKIFVHLPQTAPDEFDAKPKYPVVYVLDGEVLFQQTVAVTENLSGGGGNFNFPKMIVVGITSTDRTRDFTPTRSTDGTVMPSFLLETSGGGENFNSFLEKELIPYIESKYPASPHRTLIGHSLGGLTAIDNLVNRKRLFNGYAAIDPSLWWDNLSFLKQTKENFAKPDFKNTALFVAIANTMDKSATLQSIVEDANPNSLPIRAILDFDAFVKTGSRGLIYKSKFYGDYDHGAVAFVGVYDALPFLFDFYSINFPFQDFFNPNYKNDEILANHYRKVSERMGYRVAPPSEFVNALAHQLMESKQFERAYKFLRLNLENYPNSYKPLEAMGDYYAATNDKIKALEFHRKALAIKNDANIKSKIENLKREREK